MLKKILVACCLLMLGLPISGKALATDQPADDYEGELINTNVVQPTNPYEGLLINPFANQLPNAEFLLSTFDFGGTGYSGYCTATQPYINLRVYSYSGSVTGYLQYRGANQAWTTLGPGEKISRDSSYTFNMKTVKGDDYRVKLETAPLLIAKGYVYCW